MQTQGLISRLDGANASTFGDPARRLALSALVVGVAVGAWSGWALERVVATATPTSETAAASTAPAAIVAPITIGAAGEAADPAGPIGRSLSVAMPADDAYLTAASIPVAGTAYGRPHGPQVASVHVELIADGQSISSADIPVFSGRFAGVLAMPAIDDRVSAELRISDPLHTGDMAVVRTVTIDQR